MISLREILECGSKASALSTGMALPKEIRNSRLWLIITRKQVCWWSDFLSITIVEELICGFFNVSSGMPSRLIQVPEFLKIREA
jgi:hypothetical protein